MTHQEFQFENSFVNIYKSVILPDRPIPIQYHDKARTIVALKGGTLIIVEDSGRTSQMNFETGKAYWFAQDPLDIPKGCIKNTGTEPIELMVIECNQTG